MSHIHPVDFWQIVEQLKQTEEKLRRAEAQLKLAEEALEFYAQPGVYEVKVGEDS